MSKADAAFHAREVVSSRFQQAPKMKINRGEYHDAIYVTYLTAETNVLKDVMKLLKKNPKDSCEIILGDLHVMLEESWNAMASNPLGKKGLKKMSLMDIIEDRDVTNFVRGKAIKLEGHADAVS